MSEQTQLDALLLRYEQLRAQDTPVSPEELCQDCPELVAELKRQIQDLDSMNALLGGAAGAEDSAATTGEDPHRAGISARWSAEPLCTGSRYQVLRFHAKGGLGEVHVARDEELHREVALKRLQTLHARNSQTRARFLREAAITSRLEHPSIVPVHSVGRDAEGCPFYVMRFIQGQTLQEALEQFHAADRPGRDAGERRLALRQLLSRVIAVCNTLAYAHSKGIVHRDIKPVNIMLGPYGETLVVDWGLAKEIGAREVASGPAPQAAVFETAAPEVARSEAATETGVVIGTLAYMSPEQAAGRWDLVSPASDVYSLGVTLYTVLTGKPPFQGRQDGELLDKVKRGDFLPPRQRKKDIPRALEAICLKAMARLPEQRYATALEVAADLEHWLADEPVSAYREAPAARLARWGRRHRPLVIGTAALLLTAVVLLAVGIVLINQEKDRTAAAYAGLKSEQKRTENALAAEAKRRQQTREALDLLSSQVIDEWLAKQKELLPEHRKFLEKAVASYEELARDTGQEEASRAGVARASLRVANIRSRLGQTGEAEVAYLRSRELYQQLAAEFSATPAYRQELATTHNNLANLLAAAGRTQDAEVAYRHALDLKQQLADDFPAMPGYLDELATSHYRLGRLFYDTGRKDLAEQAYQRSLALCQRLADAYPQAAHYQAKLGQSHTILGILYNATGRAESARQAYLQDHAIRQRLVALYPQAPEHQRSLAASHINLAILDRDAGRTDSAEKGFLKAREILQPVAEAHPQVPDYQLYLAASHNNLGTLYRATARADLAEQAYRQAAAIYRRLADAYPEIVEYTIQLGGIHWNLGHLLREDLDKPEAALDAYARGIQPLQALLQKDPRQAKAREVLVNVCGGRAVALAMLGRHAEAEQQLQRAMEIDQGQSRVSMRFFGGADVRLFRARVLALAGDHVRATAQADELVKEKTLSGLDLHFLDVTYAVATSAAQQDLKLAEAERLRISDRYAASAIELLRKAQATGYFRNAAAVERLHKSKELDVWRSREDFRAFMKQLDDEMHTGDR